MTFIDYIGAIGILLATFSLWGYLSLPLALLLLAIRVSDALSGLLIRGIGLYLTTSLLAVITIATLQGRGSVAEYIFFICVSGIILLLSLIDGMGQRRKNALSDYELLQEYKATEGFDLLLCIASICIFVLGFVIPVIVVNPLTLLFLNFIRWLSLAPIIGIIIRLIGILYLFTLFYRGVVIISVLSLKVLASIWKAAK